MIGCNSSFELKYLLISLIVASILFDFMTACHVSHVCTRRVSCQRQLQAHLLITKLFLIVSHVGTIVLVKKTDISFLFIEAITQLVKIIFRTAVSNSFLFQTQLVYPKKKIQIGLNPGYCNN